MLQTFELHPRLAADTELVLDTAVCQLRLHHDARWPWLVLVPRRPDVVGWHDLAPDDAHAVLDDMLHAARLLERLLRPDRVNVGALGNLVPQLHVHVIARFENDPGWPGPVWGFGNAAAYPEPARGAFIERLRRAWAEPA